MRGRQVNPGCRRVGCAFAQPIGSSGLRWLTKLGLELGDPYVVYVERDTGVRNAMWNGKWLLGRWK
jgi:hypothetical protein